MHAHGRPTRTRRSSRTSGRLDEAAPLMQATYEDARADPRPGPQGHADVAREPRRPARLPEETRRVGGARCARSSRRGSETLGPKPPRDARRLQQPRRQRSGTRTSSRRRVESYADGGRTGAEETLGPRPLDQRALPREPRDDPHARSDASPRPGPILAESLKTIEAKLGPDHAHTKTVRKYMAAFHEAESRAQNRPESRQ